MENNKILIGVQFVRPASEGAGNATSNRNVNYTIELYILRDLHLRQLLDGIRYGIEKLSSTEGPNQQIYRECNDIFLRCIDQEGREGSDKAYFSRILLTSFNASAVTEGINFRKRNAFYKDALDTPVCELGFITSSRVILDASGQLGAQGSFDTDYIIEAFHPEMSEEIFFPEYNISTRQLYQFDTEPIQILAPPEPPAKQERGLMSMLLPSLMTAGMLILVRIAMSARGNGGMSMVILSSAMLIAGMITTAMNWKRQKKEYRANLKAWREHYQTYIDRVIAQISSRQHDDVQKLENLYPDVETLIEKDKNGVYTMNSAMYSRAPQDEDFLAFRVGLSDDVPSCFRIEGNAQEVVFSTADYSITTDQFGEHVHLHLREEQTDEKVKRSNLYRLPQDLAERYGHLKNAPLLYSLRDKGALGIVDYHIEEDWSNAYYFTSRMIFELCYYHSPEDLQFIMFFDEQDSWRNIENAMNRYKFMPHFRGLFDDRSQFVFDSTSAGQVMGALLNIMNARAAETKSGSTAPVPHVVFVVFDEYGLKEHALAEYLPTPPEKDAAASSQLGLTFVYVTKFKEYLPPYCDDVISLEDRKMAIIPRYNERETMRFHYDLPEGRSARYEAIKAYTQKVIFAFRFISALYYAQIAQNGKVPSSCDMFSLLAGTDFDPSDLTGIVERNWGLKGTARPFPSVTESLSVAIGKTESGIATLDLHEKGDGPHMLVAGTTGSGKSETIITLLLALCLQYRPNEINLLLVDMKGGGFTKRIGHLPHVVGTVTDVDGDENGTGAAYMLARFLHAMEAEIKRRKILFNRMHVDSIDGYIQACENIESHISRKKLTGEDAKTVRETARESPLSHLILVVDEFTELKRFTSENSDLDFIAEITTIARVGRSLGLHIILISQNIEGAITEDIRVNSRARLCLKVATKQASKDMLGTDLAASPYMPGNGRAYLLVGTGSKFIYFQSGYSGAGIGEAVPVEITCASKCGPYFSFYRSDKDNLEIKQQKEIAKVQGTDLTQLEALTDAICSVWEKEKTRLTQPHIVFCEPLPNVICRPGAQSVSANNNVRMLSMGIYDSPETQSQPELLLDPYRNHIAVFGGAMSGKTTFIRTMLVRMSEHPEQRPAEDIYIIDFNSSIGNYRGLKNVCACFDSSNEENIKRVFKIVEKRMDENSALLGSDSYYTVLKKDPANCPAHLTLIIENVTAFLSDERYSTYQERLQKFCREGLSRGLTVVVTASDLTGINRLLTAFGQKLAFEMPAESYYDIFNAKVSKPMKLPGRGIVGFETGNFEFQCYLPFDPKTEEADLKAMIQADKREKNENALAAFGKELTAENLADYCCDDPDAEVPAHEITLGLDYEEHRRVTVDIDLNRAIAIYGKRQFGKTNLLGLLLRGIHCKYPGAHYVFLDDGRKQLEEFYLAQEKRAPGSAQYLTELASLSEYMNSSGIAATPQTSAAVSPLGGNRSLPGLGPRPERSDGQTVRQGAHTPGIQTRESHEEQARPFTVFVLQNRSLYSTSRDSSTLMRVMLPAAISKAEEKNCLFIFSDVRQIPDADLRSVFNTNLTVALLLDNIGDFIMDRGNKSVFAEMDARELKAEYAKCSVGDGYYYNIDADELIKLKFIKYDKEEVQHGG